mmetsp:Transcript_9433/g.14855  ORF Transcript_9433/g.14855 Transcript_9433/m.14855 type:complete len:82 (-) Transcript_9433:26-271(-)
MTLQNCADRLEVGRFSMSSVWHMMDEAMRRTRLLIENNHVDTAMDMTGTWLVMTKLLEQSEFQCWIVTKFIPTVVVVTLRS